MGELPHLKALVERHADRPFAILGINTDSDKADYRRKLEQHGVTWRNAWTGGPGGAVSRSWSIDRYPTIFVLDAQHVIRAIDTRDKRLDAIVQELLDEVAAEAR